MNRTESNNQYTLTVSGFQFSIFFRRKFNTYDCDEILTNTLNIKGVAKFSLATLELFSNKKFVSILIGASKSFVIIEQGRKHV